MKKLYTLLLGFLLFLSCAATAQETPITSSFTDPEKIYLFDVDLDVLSNGQIVVTENITLNAKHQRINRGIYRDLPVL